MCDDKSDIENADDNFERNVNEELERSQVETQVRRGDACKIRMLKNIIVQENGIIRNAKGRIIARLVNGIDFNSDHLFD